MPTYEYECNACGHQFERFHKMSDPPVARCPKCDGAVRRLISAGGGIITGGRHTDAAGGCSLEATGRTCCGRDTKCGESHCKDDE
jgi:putative FmdB family regulatory protein